MVRFRHTDLRIGAGALFLPDHEGDDACQVGLKRQELQVEHQREVILEHRRHALWLIERGQLEVALFLGLLDPAFDVTNRFCVLLHLRLVLHAQLSLQPGQRVGHRVEQALLLQTPGLARGPSRAAAVAKQPLEDRARVVLHGQRLRRAAPGDRVRVRTAQDPRTRTGVGRRIHGELERRQLRLAWRSAWPATGPSTRPPGSRLRFSRRESCRSGTTRRRRHGCSSSWH